jgi:hypothetical protein
MLRYLFLLLLAASLVLPGPALALKRCLQYKREVRIAHWKEFGTKYPWWYGVAQLEEESACRAGVVSNDGVGSLGLSQITWSFWGKHLIKAGIPNLKTPRNQIRGQAFVMRDAHRHRFYQLWVSYQIYNGGHLVLKEIKRSGGKPDWEKAKAVARRKDIHFSNGQVINAAEINYRYSKRIFEHGQKYRIGSDSARYPFW